MAVRASELQSFRGPGLFWSDGVGAGAPSSVLLGLLRFELRELVLEVGQGVVPEVGRGCEIVPTLSLVGLGLEFVDPPTHGVDLVSALLLGFVRGLERLELVLNVGDGLARSDETLLRGVILLPFESVDFDLKLELTSLELVDCFGSGLAGYAYTANTKSVTILAERRSS